MEYLSSSQKIDVNAKDMDFSDLLREILSPLGLTFKIDDKVVVISPKPRTPAEKKEILLKGKVMDKGRVTLPGVAVQMKGTKYGAATDTEGEFSFAVPEQKDILLSFSFLGMKPRVLRYTGRITWLLSWRRIVPD